MHSSRLYCVSLKIFTGPTAPSAVATLHILPPANSFALPADRMAENLASTAVRFLASEEIVRAEQIAFKARVDDRAGDRSRKTLFESEGWTVVHYHEEPIAGTAAEPEQAALSVA